MTRILAVDGGQSSIRVRHSAAGGPVEVEGVSRQEGDPPAAVAAAVTEAWRLLGALPVDRAVLGLTTAPTDLPTRDRLCGAVGGGTGAAEVWLADDAVTGHAGALTLGWGVSVAAGTGVACLAVPEHGAPRIIGGHGFLLGDEGGGFWIGREGLRAVLRALDGRGPRTALSAPAAARFGGLDDLGDRLHGGDRPVNRIAHFAPDVVDVADAGDPVAVAIVEEAVRELTTLVRAGVAAAATGAARDDGPGTAAPGTAAPGTAAPTGSVAVALGGRLLAPGIGLRRRLDAALSSAVPDAVPRTADGSGLDGALLLGAAPDPGRYRTLFHRWAAAA